MQLLKHCKYTQLLYIFGRLKKGCVESGAGNAKL